MQEDQLDNEQRCVQMNARTIRRRQQRAAREGIRVVTVRFDPLDDDDAIVSAYSNALTPRTCAMQLTHMLHWTGRVPAERLCELASERGAASLVDGAQTFAQLPVSFSGRSAATSSSPVSTSGWVLPLENGMLIARRERIASTWPLMAPFEDVPHRINKFDHWNLGTYNSAL